MAHLAMPSCMFTATLSLCDWHRGPSMPSPSLHTLPLSRHVCFHKAAVVWLSAQGCLLARASVLVLKSYLYHLLMWSVLPELGHVPAL